MKRIDTDKVLERLGDWGRYQLWIFTLGNSVWFFIGFQMMCITFVADQQPFACVDKASPTPNITSWPSSCLSTDNRSTCAATNMSVLMFDPSFGSTIVSEWNLVCSRSWLTKVATSAYFFGFFIAALWCQVRGLADRWGRRKVILLSAAAVGVFGLLTAAAVQFWMFVVIRVIAGIAAAGLGVTGWVLATEVMVPSKRSYGVFVQGIFWSGGYCMTGVVAMFFPFWRTYMIAVSLPCVIMIVYYWLLPESLHWYVATEQDGEANKWIARASNVNNVKFDLADCYSEEEDDATTVTTTKSDESTMDGEQSKRNVLHILKSKPLCLHTLFMVYLWFVNTIVYYGMSLYSVGLAGNRYLNFCLSGLIELPAYFLLMYSLNLLGRRWALCIYHAGAAIALGILVFGTNESSIALSTSIWMLGKFCIASSFMGMWLFGAEVFPTTVRSAGVGVCNVAARLGGMLAPFSMLLAKVHANVPPLTFAGFALGASLLVLLLPETAGAPLAEDLDDVDPGPCLGACCFRNANTNRRAKAGSPNAGKKLLEGDA